MANDKLHQFIRAGLTNPLHPVFRFAATSPILKKYAINVQGAGLLETITPDQWEKDYPRERDTMLEVMRLCEEDAKPAPVTEAHKGSEATTPDTVKAELERKLAEAQATITARDAEIVTLKAAPATDTEGA